MPTVRNLHFQEVRWARQASADACAFCRLLAIKKEAQYKSEESALYADNEMGNRYHDECHCTAIRLDPGESFEMPDYTDQWKADYDDARNDQDVETVEDILNYMRRAQYARDNPPDEPEVPEAPLPTRRAAAIMRDNVVTKTVDAQVKPIEDDLFSHGPGEFEVVLSTEALDRDGERLFIDEWKTPLPARIHFDSDHGMSIEKTVGSGVPRIDGDSVIVRGSYAKTPHAQMVRELVNAGHITSTSVTFRNIRTAKDARPQRELLNAAFVAVPANPEAVVLSSKAAKTDDGDGSKPYGDVKYADPGYQDDGRARYPIDSEAHVRSALSYIGQASNASKYSPDELKKIKGRIHARARELGIEVAADDDKKSFEVVKQAKAGNPMGDKAQTIHDVAVALGAQCANMSEADSGEDEGANKSYETSSTKSVGLLQESAEEPAAAEPTALVAAGSAAADESADDVAQKAKLAARGKSLALQMKLTSDKEHDNAE